MRYILPAMLAILPAVAVAQPALLSSSPAAGATIAKPTRLTLTFSERLAPKLSGIQLVMTSMPGMTDHPPMPIKGFTTAFEGDGRIMVISLPRPLPAGSYDLNWRTTSGADDSKAEGKYSFTVR